MTRLLLDGSVAADVARPATRASASWNEITRFKRWNVSDGAEKLYTK